jgi:hypothetical protein
MVETYRMGLFKKRVRKEIFGSKRQNITGDWKKWHNNDLHELCAAKMLCLLVTESRRMTRGKHVTGVGWTKGHTGLWWRHLRKIICFEGSGIGGMIILKRMLKR